MIRVLAPGLRTTVQDGGRYGHLRSAIPPSGPADPRALAAANTLVGNAAAAAGLEIVGGPFRFACDDTRVVAAAGPDVTLRTRD
ncbi:MAG: allophanate hydrolase, partial [Candidatus Limnocylindria bacterium]